MYIGSYDRMCFFVLFYFHDYLQLWVTYREILNYVYIYDQQPYIVCGMYRYVRTESFRRIV